MILYGTSSWVDLASGDRAGLRPEASRSRTGVVSSRAASAISQARESASPRARQPASPRAREPELCGCM